MLDPGKAENKGGVTGICQPAILGDSGESSSFNEKLSQKKKCVCVCGGVDKERYLMSTSNFCSQVHSRI